MYRILFIEPGEYLYCLFPEGNLYCSNEITNTSSYHIYEVDSKKEAIEKLNERIILYPTDASYIVIPENKILFEIVEV
jgi:hypothetical protein